MSGVVGLAFFCGMLRAPFFGALIATDTPSPSTLSLSYDIVAIAVGAALAASATRADQTISKLQHNDSTLPATAAGIAFLGMALVAIGHTAGMSTLVPYAIGVLLASMGFAALAIAWFRFLARCPNELALELSLAAFVLSHALGIIDILPTRIEALASMAYPAASAFLLISSKPLLTLTPNTSPADTLNRQTADGGLFKNVSSPSLSRLYFLIFALILVELLCGSFLRSRWAWGGFGYHVTTKALFTYLASAAIGIAFLAIARISNSATESGLIVCGVGLATFALATVSFPSIPADILAPIVTGLSSSLLAFLIGLISIRARARECNPTLCGGLFLMIYGVASGLASSIVPTALSFRGSMPEQYISPIGIIAGCTIALGICLVLVVAVTTRRDVLQAIASANRRTVTCAQEPSPPNSYAAAISKTAHKKALDVIAQRYRLTERERETASLVARGYTAKRVSEELVIAVSTVQGYNKSIYRKMGIHRKDELIEIVNQTAEDLTSQ